MELMDRYEREESVMRLMMMECCVQWQTPEGAILFNLAKSRIGLAMVCALSGMSGDLLRGYIITANALLGKQCDGCSANASPRFDEFRCLFKSNAE